jgi:alpha-1,3-mannosyl-glycoprotein beta-1,2-N-acetylglucosaminyltransferase
MSILISQDGDDPAVATTARNFVTEAAHAPRGAVYAHHLQHPQEHRAGDTGYHRLARHFGWAFDQAFGTVHGSATGAGNGVNQVIVLEDDLLIAPDFFSYMLGAAAVVRSDPSLWTASAYNDNGRPERVEDSGEVLRSDFFPGLGWLMTRELWTELGPRWPQGYWDDWMREPPQRMGRACLRPEVSRTWTFGEEGVSVGQYYKQYLKPNKLNDVPTDFFPLSRGWADSPVAAAREAVDLAPLLKAAYDSTFLSAVRGARRVASVQELRGVADAARLAKGPGVVGNAFRRGRVDDPDGDLLFEYGGGASGFIAAAQKVGRGIMPNEKAGVPRGAYMGVVTVRFQGARLFLSPKGGPSDAGYKK